MRIRNRYPNDEFEINQHFLIEKKKNVWSMDSAVHIHNRCVCKGREIGRKVEDEEERRNYERMEGEEERR